MFLMIVLVVLFLILQIYAVNLITGMLKNAQKIEEYHMNGDDVLKRFLIKKNKSMAIILLVDWMITLILVIGIVNIVLDLIRI